MNWITIIIIALISFLLMKIIIKSTKFIFRTILFLVIVAVLSYALNEYNLDEKLSFHTSPKFNETNIGSNCNNTEDCINSMCITGLLNATSGKCGILTNSSCILIFNNTKRILSCPELSKSNCL